MKKSQQIKEKKRVSNANLIVVCVFLFAVSISLLMSVVNVFTMEKERVDLQEGMGGTAGANAGVAATTEVIEETLEETIKRQVPMLYQWDERWADYVYGAGTMETTGCGPTCLSMVAMYLLQNTELTPTWMADFSVEYGFCVPGNGTSWSFMSEGAKILGLNVEEVAPSEGLVAENLAEGNPIICIMGPGDFTDGGHFIVLTGMAGDRIRINDPNSRANSEKLWYYDEIEGQIRNMWIYHK